MKRRQFIQKSVYTLPLLSTASLFSCEQLSFRMGVAQWSFHKSIRSGKMNNLDFAITAKEKFNIDVVEYVNQFFSDKAKDKNYLSQMKKRSDDFGVTNLLIMIDDEGSLGDSDKAKRNIAVENHKKWVEAAQYLGCTSIRVNAQGSSTEEEVSKYVSESLNSLGAFSKDFGVDVIVENHGGYSSNAQWLVNVIKNANSDNVGTLPDFGNFCIQSRPDNLSSWGALEGCSKEYDKYKGVEELLPYARSVSAKSLNFDVDGNCVEIDFYKMMKVIKGYGYNGYISIEYEGSSHSEEDGVRLTKELLLKSWAQA